MSRGLLLLSLALCVIAVHSQEEEERFSRIQRKCNGRITHKVLKKDKYTSRSFIPYANTTGSSEAECVDKCFTRSDFCSAVKFLSRERICLFSFKWLNCKKGDQPIAATRIGRTSRILHCIQCDGSISSLKKTTNRNLPVRRPAPRTRRPTPSRRLTTRRPRPTARRTSLRLTTRRPKIEARKTTKRQPTTPRTTTLKTTKTTVLSTTPFPTTRIVPTTQKINITRSDCLIDMMKPCNHGFGRECSMIDAEGCPLCTCPYKSPARGCAGPQGLAEFMRKEMIMQREHCPNGQRVQVVHRWYRQVDRVRDIDHCVQTKEPYCGWLQDVNIWRMPRTEDECNYFCYEDDELKARGLNFFSL